MIWVGRGVGEIILLGEGDESLPEEYPQSDEGEDGTLTLKGVTLEVSIVFSLWPRWDIRRDPTVISTPVEARHLLTSVAQAVYPAWNLSRSSPGFKANICCLFSFLKCLTVNSSTSAFSSLEMLSPSVCRANTMRSLSSSRQALIRALLFLSRRGFITFLYWSVLDIGSSSKLCSVLMTGAMFNKCDTRAVLCWMSNKRLIPNGIRPILNKQDGGPVQGSTVDPDSTGFYRGKGLRSGPLIVSWY